MSNVKQINLSIREIPTRDTFQRCEPDEIKSLTSVFEELKAGNSLRLPDQ
ncbi:MAG: hypothetical protein GF353_05580 [Candidatus Lokiarchaeota archaeon]|nr:hypothetical protein [Candidatus Lokiarchaeota archaeon]